MDVHDSTGARSARHRKLVALLRHELRTAGQAAIDNGVPAEAVNAYLAERISALGRTRTGPSGRRMNALYALLVGINAYREPVPALRGCRNDVERANAFLASRVAPGVPLHPRVLRDGEATRGAVIAGFREHLAAAGPDDTALFWFSGHGSWYACPAHLRHLEPDGQLQSLVCVDSRHDGVPDLLDKELAVLVGEVTARQAHVVVVLDCCHSASGDRDASDGGGVLVRYTDGLTALPPLDRLLPQVRPLFEAGSAVAAPAYGDHVTLSACRNSQRAHETWSFERPPHGVFSGALLDALGRLGPEATYRALHTAAGCDTENTFPNQVPVLTPSERSIVDVPFLGGRLRTPATNLTMRHVHDRWEVNVGSCHGLVAGTPDEPVRVAVHGSDPLREAVVREVLTERSIVEPVAPWVPATTDQFPVVVTSLPVPATSVAIDAGDDPGTVRALDHALRTAAPGGRPSPHVRLARQGEPAEVRVAAPAPGTLRILGADGEPLAPDRTGSAPEAARLAVADLEHIARWRRVRALQNPMSRLGDAIRLEVVRDELALRPGDDGAIVVPYQWENGQWRAPTVFVRLHNTTDRALYCVLLDLTDRFEIHAELFPGATVAPRSTAHAARGAPIELSLPKGREARPGARARDWLKLLVAETEFSAEPFALVPLGDPTPVTRTPLAVAGVLGRLGMVAVHRTMRSHAVTAHDWSARTVPMTTVVPHRP